MLTMQLGYLFIVNCSQVTAPKWGGLRKTKKGKKWHPAAPAVRVTRPVDVSAPPDREGGCLDAEDPTPDNNGCQDLKPAAPSTKKRVDFILEKEPPIEELSEGGSRRFLCDTGCMFDLVSRDTVELDPDCEIGNCAGS